MRNSFWIAAAAAVLAAAGQLKAASVDEIIAEATAQRYGLTRAWAVQAQVDVGRGRLQALVLNDGTLFAQSSRATVEAIDAETGQALWKKMVGLPDYVSLPPGACRDLVGVINGSRLFVLNRYTGEILWQTQIEAVPGGAPAMSVKRAYVPTSSGTIISYRLDPVTDPAKELGKINPNWATMTDEEKKEVAKQAEEERRQNLRLHQEYSPPLLCASAGRAMVPPLVTTQTREEEFVTWITDKGYVHLGRVDRRDATSLSMRFRLLAKGSIGNPPAYMPPNSNVTGDMGRIFIGSSEGEVMAISERDGDILWRFPTGDAVDDSPVVIRDRLYVTTELGTMFALEARTGKPLWTAPEVMHFVAAGRQRVYAADKLGRLRILDMRTGSLLGTIPTMNLPIKVCNNQTDRIYLATDSGLVQCLHEVDLVKPIAYLSGSQSNEDAPAKTALKPKPKSVGGAAKPAAPPAKKTAPKPPAKPDNSDAFGSDAAPAPAAKPAAKPTRPAGKATPEPTAKPADDAGDPFGN